jgi:16S rRNA (cytidine1402-2'-O)-methyltransferase
MGQSFTFHGYLPVDKKALQNKIREIQQMIMQKDQTQIFMETPYQKQFS